MIRCECGHGIPEHNLSPGGCDHCECSAFKHWVPVHCKCSHSRGQHERGADSTCNECVCTRFEPYQKSDCANCGHTAICHQWSSDPCKRCNCRDYQEKPRTERSRMKCGTCGHYFGNHDRNGCQLAYCNCARPTEINQQCRGCDHSIGNHLNMQDCQVGDCDCPGWNLLSVLCKCDHLLSLHPRGHCTACSCNSFTSVRISERFPETSNN